MNAEQAAPFDGEATSYRGTEKRSPWELLDVEADASPAVIDLAYARWQRRAGAGNGRVGEIEAGTPTATWEQPEDWPVDDGADGEKNDQLVEQATAPMARLVIEMGSGWRSVELDGRPVRIGADPTCDVVVEGARTGEEARIWMRDERFFFHGIAASINGQRIAWAVLEDGDVIEVGDTMLKLELVPQAG